jgi:hypothetical protein
MENDRPTGNRRRRVALWLVAILLIAGVGYFSANLFKGLRSGSTQASGDVNLNGPAVASASFKINLVRFFALIDKAPGTFAIATGR